MKYSCIGCSLIGGASASARAREGWAWHCSALLGRGWICPGCRRSKTGTVAFSKADAEARRSDQEQANELLDGSEVEFS